jgi:hypothetical protein
LDEGEYFFGENSWLRDALVEAIRRILPNWQF